MRPVGGLDLEPQGLVYPSIRNGNGEICRDGSIGSAPESEVGSECGGVSAARCIRPRTTSAPALWEHHYAKIKVVILGQENGYACFLLWRGGSVVKVDAKGEQGVLLPARDEGLPVRAGIVSVQRCQVQLRRLDAERIRFLRRRHGE